MIKRLVSISPEIFTDNTTDLNSRISLPLSPMLCVFKWMPPHILYEELQPRVPKRNKRRLSKNTYLHVTIISIVIK